MFHLGLSTQQPLSLRAYLAVSFCIKCCLHKTETSLVKINSITNIWVTVYFLNSKCLITCISSKAIIVGYCLGHMTS